MKNFEVQEIQLQKLGLQTVKLRLLGSSCLAIALNLGVCYRFLGLL